jgi:branched-chain amino acid transport system substrate-binding protein
MGVKDINAAGGLLGRQVEIETFDIQDLAPERLMLASSTLVQQKKADVIVGGYVGNGTEALAFGKYPTPFFHDSGNDVWVEEAKKNGFTNIWHTCNLNSDLVPANINYLDALPYTYPNKKVVLLFGQDPLSDAMRAQAAAIYKEKGWDIVLNRPVPYGTTDYGPYLTTIKAEDPALILFWVYSPTDQITFFKQFLKDPTNSIVDMDGANGTKEFLDLGGKMIDGITGVANLAQQLGLPPDTQDYQDWYDRFTKEEGNPPAGLSGMTYASVMIWAEAVKAVGDPTKYDEINAWLATSEVTLFDGIPPYHFNENHYWSLDELPMGWGQIQNGGQNTTLFMGTTNDPTAQAYTDLAGNAPQFVTPSWIK